MRENLRSIYVLLFLTIAFFFLQTQDAERYVELFALHRGAIQAGELWRLFTFQFLVSSPIWLIFELLILWIMGSALEEELGTARFLAFYLIASFVTAGAGLAMNVVMLGAYFKGIALLAAFALRFPEHVFYIFFVLPVKVKWLAWITVAFTAIGALWGDRSMMAALAGTAAGVGYVALSLRAPLLPRRQRKPLVPRSSPAEQPRAHAMQDENLASFEKTRRAAAGTRAEVEAELHRLESRIVAGVNICPPADFKPAADDRYCARCEGFAECSARWLRANADGQSSEEPPPSGP